jgi:hypothetical protein
LEQKIESLVTLLSATQGNVLPNHSPVQTPVEPLPQENQQEENQQEENRRADHRPGFSWFVDPPRKNQPSWGAQLPLHCGGQPSVASTPYSSTVVSSATPASTLDSISAPSIDIQVNNGDRLLKVYREYYEADFPFVVLPPKITSQELKTRKPWLAMTISMVASHENRVQQLAMAKEIIMEVASALLIRSEKSLDMLESLIIYNVWFVVSSKSTPH